MPAFTINQWAILFLVLLLGWLIGLVSRGGGAKWRRAYEAERDARTQEQAEHEETLAAANARIEELDRVEPVAVAPAPAATVETLDLTRDDLARIRGVGAAGERRLNAEGIYLYSDITGLSPAEESALEERMGADPGYIEQERWREQAALLQAGKDDEHRAKFG